MREICLDTETTGMAAKEGDRIIEIGCVELGEHGLTDKNFHEYIDPERQMAAEVMDRVGIHEGTVFRYHQARRNTRNYQVDLETLQYDLLYGKQYTYDGENPFERTKMKMGLYDVTLDSISLVSPSDFTYYIHGTNFTPSSQEIRTWIQEGKSIRYYVPDPVIDFIEKKGIYKRWQNTIS